MIILFSPTPFDHFHFQNAKKNIFSHFGGTKRYQKWYFRWSNQKSENTFMDSTFVVHIFAFLSIIRQFQSFQNFQDCFTLWGVWGGILPWGEDGVIPFASLFEH